MPSEMVCPACGFTVPLQDEFAPKSLTCPNCSTAMQMEAVGERGAGETPPALWGPAWGATDDVNPYASPRSHTDQAVPAYDAADSRAITPGIRQAMSQTRPWVLFLAILGFVLGGLTVFGALAVITVSFVSEKFIMGPFYLIYAAIYLGCAYYLFLYARRIRAFERTDRVVDLEAALVAQKSFWKLLGIIVAIMLVVGVVAMVAMVVFFAGLATDAGIRP